jgi:hypothetical protein
VYVSLKAAKRGGKFPFSGALINIPITPGLEWPQERAITNSTKALPGAGHCAICRTFEMLMEPPPPSHVSYPLGYGESYLKCLAAGVFQSSDFFYANICIYIIRNLGDDMQV